MNGYQPTKPEEKETESTQSLNKMLKWAFFAAVGCFIASSAYSNYIAKKEEPHKLAVAESEKETQRAMERILEQRRQTGFVEVRKMTNAFEEVIAMDYQVISKTPGVTMVISTGASGSDIKEICFNAVTMDEKKYIFAPYTTIPVYAKFDGGETRQFNATRGISESYLCITSKNRFLFHMQNAKSMQVAIPYLDHYEHTSEVSEFNLTTYNGMIK